MNTRAQTHVDRGAARVWNRWMERRWSAFMGKTVSLIQLEGGFEWVTSRCEEFALVIDGAIHGIMELGNIACSEECDEHGATLMIRKWCPGLEFVVRTMAFHGAPGLCRSTRVRNTGQQPITVERVTTDSVALLPENVRVRTHGFVQSHDAIEWRTNERAAALTIDDTESRGLLFGQDGGGVLQLLAPVGGVCATVVEGPRTLAPGQAWTLPDAYVVPYTGDLRRAVSTVFADFLEARCAAGRTAQRPPEAPEDGESQSTPASGPP